MKVLRFPAAGRGVVVWSRRASGDLGKGWSEVRRLGFEEVGLARGEVAVPEDHEVALELVENVTDLPGMLGGLDPGDVSWFAIRFELDPVEIGDAEVKALCRLKGLESLSLQRAPISDGALGDIATLENLRQLNLTWVNTITDEGFEQLRALRKVEKVFAHSRRMGDQAFAVIVSWKDTLREARFGEMKVSDQAFMAIRQCGKLIGIHCPQVGPAAITALAKLPLDRLIIYNNQRMDDQAMKLLVPQFMQMSELKSLDLGGSAITDEGARELAKCRNLTWLAVHRTKMTAEGLEELKKALPGCKIE